MTDRTKLLCHLLVSAWSMGIGITTGGGASPRVSPKESDARAVRFDTIIELNAPLCRTHVALFARCWVSGDSYRIAVVWAEPHAGALNFPIYPPTLNVASDPNAFTIRHQFIPRYDGTHCNPLGQRGPFRHRFNSYDFSDTRFAEQEALDMRLCTNDLPAIQEAGEGDIQRLFDLPRWSGGNQESGLPQARVRMSDQRLDRLDLLDDRGDLLKAIDYQYAEQDDGMHLQQQTVLLPERPMTVDFGENPPTITVAGEKREYSQLETTHHAGGRTCVVDYEQIDLGGRQVSLPARITVSPNNGKRVLRSARLGGFTPCAYDAKRIAQAAEQFSLLDPEEIKCRDLLLRHWLKDPSDVNRVDVDALRLLRTHFTNKSDSNPVLGGQLKRINILLQLDWMLGDTTQLDCDFQRYLSLLNDNNLGKMVLFGGQCAIDLTLRWGYIPIADSLIKTWVDAAIAGNDTATILGFAAVHVARGRLCTIIRLMNALQNAGRLSPAQEYAVRALHCMALARLHAMLADPDNIKKELDIAQARWIFAKTDAARLGAQLAEELGKAHELFGSFEQPTRENATLKSRLDQIRSQKQSAVHPDVSAQSALTISQ